MSEVNAKEAVVSIPFISEDAAEYHSFESSPPDCPNAPNDIDLRLKTYRGAWNKTLERMQWIVRRLYQPSLEDMEYEVAESLTKYLPGLAQRETPVVTLVDPIGGSMMIKQILETFGKDIEAMGEYPCIRSQVVHFHPEDFSSVTNAMRNLVSALVGNGYDIQTLVAWYEATCLADGEEDLIHNFVVVLHDFERFEVPVMEDVFYIVSSDGAPLPITFILSLSIPTESFLQSTYSRRTLSTIKLINIDVPNSASILKRVLHETFFDVAFEPPIVLGATALEFIFSYFKNHNLTLDALFSSVQIVFMKHFSTTPLAALITADKATIIEALTPESMFRTLLASRLRPTHPTLDTPIQLANAYIQVQSTFYRAAQVLRMVFRLFVCLENFFVSTGYRGFNWAMGTHCEGLFRSMINLHRNRLESEMGTLNNLLFHKLTTGHTQDLATIINGYYEDLPASFHMSEADRKLQALLIEYEAKETFSHEDAEAFAQSFWDYIEDRIAHLPGLVLYDTWYTGNAPIPMEILNPSVKASVLAGLLRPYAFTGRQQAPQDLDLADLADITILFKRYLDSGRLINAYDWFESFKSVLDVQRERRREAQGKGKGKGKGKATKKGKRKRDALPESEPEAEEDDEEWKVQVQARFMRALHELDHLGFLSHTGRKEEHVQRTVFDIDDAE